MAHYWLMKSEPDTFSIDHLERRGVAGWDGVRNFQARNFMRQMEEGDLAFFYHSSVRPPGIAGILRVARTAYPDPTQFDKSNPQFEPKASADRPYWYQIDAAFVSRSKTFVTLDQIKEVPALKSMVLLRRSRLSVQPVTPEEWKTICRLAGL